MTDRNETGAAGRIDRLYGLNTPDDAATAYAAVAESYAADHMARGFLLPFVGAGVLARHMGAENGSILDAGCGTGLVGAALAGMGFGPIAGLDMSPEMLRVAETTGAYKALVAGDLSRPLPFATRSFDAVIAIGVFGPGHAPPQALRELNRVAGYGCPVVFSLREDTYEEQGFPAVIDDLTATDAWRPLSEGEPCRVYLMDKPQLKARLFAFMSR